VAYTVVLFICTYFVIQGKGVGSHVCSVKEEDHEYSVNEEDHVCRVKEEDHICSVIVKEEDHV
jgi:hypothetical protein